MKGLFRLYSTSVLQIKKNLNGEKKESQEDEQWRDPSSVMDRHAIDVLCTEQTETKLVQLVYNMEKQNDIICHQSNLVVLCYCEPRVDRFSV